MESLSKTSDCRKRRRSSVENDIMEKRLQTWRAKKGLPTLSKIQEEREKTKLLSKHTTPSHPLKRKSIQISKSEKKMERTDDKSKHARFYTPGPSTHHDVAIDRRCTGSNLQINKQPGRRSLAPSTRMNTPQQSSNSVKRNESKNIAADNKVTSIPNKRDKITAAVPQQVPIRSHDLSHVIQTQGRKSVRFSSPKMSAAVEECDENIPFSCTPKVTPGPSKSKRDIRGRLEQWLIAKGKTPSRFNNFLGYESSLQHTPGPAGGSHTRRRSGTPHLGRNRRDTPGKGLGTRRSGEGAVHGTMKECLEMLEEGCPLEDMLAWLDGMVTKVPLIQQCACYWLCRAKIAEKQGGDQSAIECLFEAVEFNPEEKRLMFHMWFNTYFIVHPIQPDKDYFGQARSHSRPTSTVSCPSPDQARAPFAEDEMLNGGEEFVLELHKDEIDKANKDKTNKVFSPNLKAEKGVESIRFVA